MNQETKKMTSLSQLRMYSCDQKNRILLWLDYTNYTYFRTVMCWVIAPWETKEHVNTHENMPSMMSMNPIIIVRSETYAHRRHSLEKNSKYFSLTFLGTFEMPYSFNIWTKSPFIIIKSCSKVTKVGPKNDQFMK